jgi:hypothetical protein
MNREQPEWTQHLLGKSVVNAELTQAGGELTLSDGSKLRFQDDSDCCSWIEVTKVATTDNIITHAEVVDTDEDEGGYEAKLVVLTEAGEVNLVEADASAGTGYYLHGFALGVSIDKGVKE